MGKRIRVLLVDEHAHIRSALRALIGTTSDIEVIGDVEGEKRIVELAARLQPDVVILDLPALGKRGLSVVATLLQMRPQTRILVLASEINARDVKGAISAGVSGYLPKGAPAQDILRAIRSLQEGKSAFEPAALFDSQ